MSALLKPGRSVDIAVVRPLALLRAEKSLGPEIDEEKENLHAHISALEAQVRERDQAIEALRSEVQAAYHKGHEEGRVLGGSEAEDRQSDRLALLEGSLQCMQANRAEGMSVLERHSLLLARDCLDMVLGNPDYRTELVEEILRAQVGRIDKAMLLDIKLSREDFADEQALAALGERIGLSGTTVGIGADMQSGTCLMTMRLGQMEVGLGRQWSVLREALEQIAGQEGGP